MSRAAVRPHSGCRAEHVGMRRKALSLLVFVPALAGCGGAHKTVAPTTTRGATSAQPGTTSANALQAEANAAATGDIPDNQVFLVFRNSAAGYSIKYPEGWAESGRGSKLVFRDENNIVRVVVPKRAAPTPVEVRAQLAGTAGVHVQSGPQLVTIGRARALKVVYTTRSAPNAVTGKRVTLMVDRYYLAHAGKEAMVDLGTPVGVDNVDAYRLMIESFRWR